MSCKYTLNNCICNVVETIKDLQDAVLDQCHTSCYSNLLSPTNELGDTIPLILYTKEGEPFKTFGNIGEIRGGDCFNTVFFRAEEVINNCCVTFSLLKPGGDSESDICDVTNLMKTNYCIEIDLSCFCAIQCLDPRLILK